MLYSPLLPSRILVAIPTFNEEAHITATLTDLLADAPEMGQVRIIVADGGSTDRTREMVGIIARHHPNISLIDNPDRLQAAAINRVVEHCAEPHHDVLVRVDAHARYPRGYVLDVAKIMRDRGAQGLATVMVSSGSTCFQRGAAWAADTLIGSGGSWHRGGHASGWVDHGHHAGFDLTVFRKVGGYDTGFVANEDAELDHRIGKEGGRIWLEAGLRIGYVMRPSIAALARQYWRYGVGRAQTLTKHRMRPRLRQVIPPLAVIGNALGVVLAPVLPVALVIPLTYLSVLLGVTLRLLVRHRSLCALWAGPALATMHHAWGLGCLTEMLRARLP